MIRSIRLCLMLFGFLIALPACSLVEPDPRPNIIFIMADDLGPEWIGCYGSDSIQTPHIDRMAAEGMRFTNAYSMPKCTPTRVALLTGTYPFRNGWTNHWDVPRWGAGCHFDPRYYTTFANVMKSSGYRTAIAGKWQINDFRVQPNILEDHGFDDWFVWTGYETENPPSAKRYWDPYIHSRAGSKTYPDAFGPKLYTDFLIDFLQAESDQPACIYFPMVSPHTPLVTTPLEPDAEGKLGKHKAMVRYIDHLVGRFLAAVEQAENQRPTIVIFTTDNGSTSGIKGQMNGQVVSGGKGQMAEAGCRAPFVVWSPGLVPAGVVTDALTDFTDMLPTFAEFGRAELPKDQILDGKSIAPVILGQQEHGPREWIMAMGGGVAKLNADKRVVPKSDYADRVIRDKRYKLWVVNRKPAKLYDLQQDPAEASNLIDSQEPAHRDALEKLSKVADSFPDQDAAPRYDPTPAQSWDRKPRN